MDVLHAQGASKGRKRLHSELSYKRLERGTFGWPDGEGVSCCLRSEELQLLLHGIEGKPRRHWYRT